MLNLKNFRQSHFGTIFVSVHDVYKDKGELKVSGKISSGVISAGETIVALPSHESLQVQSLKVSKTSGFCH